MDKILYSLVNSAPVNVTITGETTLTEHSSVTYQCSADGFPAPLKVYAHILH